MRNLNNKRWICAVGIAAGAALLWNYAPVPEHFQLKHLMAEGIRWAIGFSRQSIWAFPLFMLLIGVLNLFLVPINVLLLAAALAFPGWKGFMIGMGGAVAAAVIASYVGRVIGAERLRRRFGKKFEAVADEVAANGLSSVVVFSLVPVAPNLATNMIAGVCRVPLRKLVAGTVIGFLPGLVLLNLLGREMRDLLKDPSYNAALWVLGVIGLIFLTGVIARRYKQRVKSRESEESSPLPLDERAIEAAR